jgi:hypothetical protein
MTKFLLFATALTVVIAQGQIPKLSDKKIKNVRKPDLPNVEAPKVEVPKLEAPKLEAPKLEAPKLEAPKFDSSKLNPPKVDPLSLPMPASFNIKEAQGGLMRMPLTGSKKELSAPPAKVVNERSTLSKKAYILNDAKCPVSIEELNVTPVEGKEWQMMLDGQILARTAITAADVRFAMFDLFGNHVATKQILVVEDIAADTKALVLGPGWSTSEKEAKVQLSTFAFVAQVRLADGSVWKYDPIEVARALYKLKLRIDPSRLEAVKE